MRPGVSKHSRHYLVVINASLIDSFADSARLINQLDLIITCDTATAHLAGGMDKPVWVLLPFASDWRWGYQHDDTPCTRPCGYSVNRAKVTGQVLSLQVSEELRILASGAVELNRQTAAS